MKIYCHCCRRCRFLVNHAGKLVGKKIWVDLGFKGNVMASACPPIHGVFFVIGGCVSSKASQESKTRIITATLTVISLFGNLYSYQSYMPVFVHRLLAPFLPPLLSQPSNVRIQISTIVFPLNSHSSHTDQQHYASLTLTVQQYSHIYRQPCFLLDPTVQQSFLPLYIRTNIRRRGANASYCRSIQ